MDARRKAAVVLAGFSAFLVLYAPQPLLPALAREFGLSAARAGLLVSVPTLAVALAAPFVGLLADRFGRKNIIVPATLLLALPTLAAATSSGYSQLLFWRFLQGVLTPGIFAVTVAYINEEWHDGVGAAMAAYVSGTVLGGFTGRTLSAFIATHASWRTAFAVLGVLNLASGLAIWRWLPPGRRFVVGPASRPVGPIILRHLRNPQLLATYTAGFCVLFAMMAAFTYVNFHLAAAPFHLNTSQLGLVFGVFLVGALVTPFAGHWIDRLGNRIAIVLAFSAGIGGSALTLIPSLLAVMAGLTLICTGVFVAQSAATSYIGKVSTEGKAAAVGLYVMFYYTGGSAGAALPGLLWTWGGWTACVALIAAVQLLTIAVAWKFWSPAAPAR
ncbi:MAG: MFS transporter [Candidatus Solibacter usitatus]|nr:MFS transporter [Candidatus Solibacter usitatus]